MSCIALLKIRGKLFQLHTIPMPDKEEFVQISDARRSVVYLRIEDFEELDTFNEGELCSLLICGILYKCIYLYNYDSELTEYMTVYKQLVLEVVSVAELCDATAQET